MPSTEQLEIKVVGSARRPEPQRIDGLAPVPDDRPVVWNAEEGRRPADDGSEHAFPKFERTIQFHLDRIIQPHDFPRIRPPQPIIRLLTLPSVLDRLLENPVLI